MSDLIIPRTDTPGVVDLKAHDFALLMADECFRPEQREPFKKGLDGAARAGFIEELDGGGSNVESASFLKVYPALVVRGYTESEHFLTRVRIYELVPGRYRGRVPISA